MQDMDIATKTRFDWIIQGHKCGPEMPFDREVIGDDKVSVIPTKGSIVPGWLLVVPREQTLSIAKLGKSAQIHALQHAQKAKELITKMAKHVFIFEHGPCYQKSKAGCGVDQAHLHVVPLDFDLIEYIKNESHLNWHEVSTSSPWENIPSNQEYYYISDSIRSYVGFVEKPESQFFRKKIAEKLNRGWDYNTHPYAENATATLEYLSNQPLIRVA